MKISNKYIALSFLLCLFNVSHAQQQDEKLALVCTGKIAGDQTILATGTTLKISEVIKISLNFTFQKGLLSNLSVSSSGINAAQMIDLKNSPNLLDSQISKSDNPWQIFVDVKNKSFPNAIEHHMLKIDRQTGTVVGAAIKTNQLSDASVQWTADCVRQDPKAMKF